VRAAWKKAAMLARKILFWFIVVAIAGLGFSLILLGMP
jgi:hypothetical protein